MYFPAQLQFYKTTPKFSSPVKISALLLWGGTILLNLLCDVRASCRCESKIHTLGTNKTCSFSDRVSRCVYLFPLHNVSKNQNSYFILRILVDLKKEVWYQKCHDPVCREKNFKSQSMYFVC